MTARTEELIARVREGDGQAFAHLVADHGPDVLRVCVLITANQSLAEDASQNTWRQVWRKLDTLRDVASLQHWLLRVAANEAKQALRRDRRHAALQLDAARDVPTSDSLGDPGLGAALRALEPADRELLAHRYVLGFSSDEIGRHLGISAEGVRSRLKRIRDRLLKELDDDE